MPLCYRVNICIFTKESLMEIFIAIAVVVSVGAYFFFKRADKNSDGKIDAMEAQAAVQEVTVAVKEVAKEVKSTAKKARTTVARAKVALKKPIAKKPATKKPAAKK